MSAPTNHQRPRDQIRLLFVDPEPDDLAGTLRALEKARPDWVSTACSSPEAAIQRLEANGADVIIVDVSPGDTSVPPGVDLLHRVRRLRPTTARVAMSRDPDRATTFRASRVAHQFVSKPCNVERLKSTIDQIVECRRTVPLPNLLEVIGEVDELPTPGPIHQQLTTALQGEYTIADLESIVVSDVALTAELLRLVNSSFFGLIRQLEQVGDAISFLGVDVLGAVVASRSVFRPSPDSPIDVEAVNRHSKAVASLAALAHGSGGGGRHLRTQAFAAGLLHDVGLLVLAQLGDLGDRTRAAEILAEHDSVHERFAFGADRYSLGSYLLSLWGFDHAISSAVGSLGAHPAGIERSGLAWTLRIAHEAIIAGRISEADAISGDEVDLKMALADVVDELDGRGVLTRPMHTAA